MGNLITFQVQSSESLDMPSTSTGITASSSATTTVYRIYDQDSDDDMTGNPSSSTNGNNGCTEPPESTEQPPPLINILPTPLNGTHDMYINILQVPVSNGNSTTNGSVITVQNDNYAQETAHDSDSSSAVSDLETVATPNGKYSNCEAHTPDSGIVAGPCGSSTGSLNSRFASSTGACSSTGTSSNRHLQTRHHIDENSDDPDWAYENFKKRVKQARYNFKNTFGCDSDSN